MAGAEPTRQVDSKLKTRAKKIVHLLRQDNPGAKCALHFSTPLELLIATILSAQSTDKLVNSLTPKLFAKYRSAADWANAPLEQVEQDIKSTGFYHNKAKHISACCSDIVARFGGEVPDSMDELVTLAGVGRKTANVLLTAIWGKPGIVVDTHMTRLAGRLGLASAKDPVKIEFALQAIIPEEEWAFFSHAVVLHGRAICTAKKPDCPGCVLNRLCPSAFTFDVPAPTGWQSEIKE